LNRSEEDEEMKKRNRTPSPIKRIEDSLYINNIQAMDFSMNFSEINSSFMSQNEELISLKSFNGAGT